MFIESWCLQPSVLSIVPFSSFPSIFPYIKVFQWTIFFIWWPVLELQFQQQSFNEYSKGLFHLGLTSPYLDYSFFLSKFCKTYTVGIQIYHKKLQIWLHSLYLRGSVVLFSQMEFERNTISVYCFITWNFTILSSFLHNCFVYQTDFFYSNSLGGALDKAKWQRPQYHIVQLTCPEKYAEGCSRLRDHRMDSTFGHGFLTNSFCDFAGAIPLSHFSLIAIENMLIETMKLVFFFYQKIKYRLAKNNSK